LPPLADMICATSSPVVTATGPGAIKDPVKLEDSNSKLHDLIPSLKDTKSNHVLLLVKREERKVPVVVRFIDKEKKEIMFNLEFMSSQFCKEIEGKVKEELKRKDLILIVDGKEMKRDVTIYTITPVTEIIVLERKDQTTIKSYLG
jgi:hypothetical protein